MQVLSILRLAFFTFALATSTGAFADTATDASKDADKNTDQDPKAVADKKKPIKRNGM